MGTLRTSTKVGWWVCGRAEAGIQHSDLWPNFWPTSPPSYPHTWLDFPLLRTTGFIHQINTLYLWVRSPGCDTFTIKLAGKILGHLSFLQESSKPIFLPGTAASAPGWGESTPSGPGGRSCCGYRDLGDSQGLGLSWRARWCLLERGPLHWLIWWMSPLTAHLLPRYQHLALCCCKLHLGLRVKMWIPEHLNNNINASLEWKAVHPVPNCFIHWITWICDSPSKFLPVS